jgi:cell division control protein 6
MPMTAKTSLRQQQHHHQQHLAKSQRHQVPFFPSKQPIFISAALPLTPVSAKRTISLFTPTKKHLSTLTTQTPPSTHSAPINTIFTRAKSVLRRGTVPGKLAARTSERAQITTFLTANLTELKQGGFIYLCGPPGTGKTALMTEIFEEFRSCPSSTDKANMAFINCMSFERAEEVFDRIIEELGTGKAKGPVDSQLEKLFLKSKSML